MRATQNSAFGMVGLGLRREMLDELLAHTPKQIDFMEVAPENWLKLGGRFKKQFKTLTDANNFVCHGLSLSIGSPEPLDIEFVKSLKTFFDQHNMISQIEYKAELYQLNQDKTYYQAEIIQIREDLEELLSDNEKLERFARERYYMKRDNEEIFVFVPEDEE